MKKSQKELLQKSFETNILPNLKSVEKERLDTIKMLCLKEAISFLGLIVASTIAYHTFLYLPEVLMVVLAVIIALIYYMVELPFDTNREYCQKLKKQFYPIFLRKIHNIKWGIDKHNIETNYLSKSGLFAKFMREYHDDTFKGCHNEVNFNITESRLYDLKTNYLSKGAQKYEAKVFQGIILSFDSNKKHDTTTLVTTKNDFNTKNNITVNFTAIIALIWVFPYLYFSSSSLNLMDWIILFAFIIGPAYFVSEKISNHKKWNNKIKLEDPVWEKRFNVFSKDEVKARYLVTTAFMERFLNLNTALGVKRAKCSFYQDKIIFAISTNKNCFETSNLFRSATNYKSWHNFINELASIFDIIEYFKLDEKTRL